MTARTAFGDLLTISAIAPYTSLIPKLMKNPPKICHKTGINPYQNLPVSDKTISNLQYQYTNINFTVQLNDIKFNNIQYDILKSINLAISNLGHPIRRHKPLPYEIVINQQFIFQSKQI